MQFYERPEPEYKDRNEAGRTLAARLEPRKTSNMMVLAIPNGGIPVAAEITKELKLPLFLLVVRKLQFPGNPEAGFGALTADGFLHLNLPLIQQSGLTEEDITRQRSKAQQSIESRIEYFGEWTRIPSVKKSTVVLVDDGLASGFTMEAAIDSLRNRQARKIYVATPTASIQAFRRVQSRVDEVICPHVKYQPVFAVANAYENWYDVSDEEALACLKKLKVE